MFLRYELHNHTRESDAAITCEELLSVMEAQKTDVFALTDHNTVSGHGKMKRLLADGKPHPACIYGMEFTTYYGHILCLNMHTYVPWDSIDRHAPEKLLRACHAAGALTGIAHPFAFGDPFARGCRFEMTLTDFSDLDFIEIINNSQRMGEVNSHGIAWWEELCLRGLRIAPTAGMDLHRERSFADTFATYLDAQGDPSEALARAVRNNETFVSRGMLAVCENKKDGITVRLLDTHKPEATTFDRYILTLRGQTETRAYPLASEETFLPASDLPRGILIPKLYGDTVSPDTLVCVSHALFPQ